MRRYEQILFDLMGFPREISKRRMDSAEKRLLSAEAKVLDADRESLNLCWHVASSLALLLCPEDKLRQAKVEISRPPLDLCCGTLMTMMVMYHIMHGGIPNLAGKLPNVMRRFQECNWFLSEERMRLLDMC